MISERRLATDFSSFWRTILPLSDAFTRQTNSQLERFASPLPGALSAERSGLVSELGFRYFAAIHSGGLLAESTGLEPVELRTEIEEGAVAYIARLPGHSGHTATPNDAERYEAKLIADRLQLFFGLYERDVDITIEPEFPGCGIVDRCYGDIKAGKTLYEVKNVGRDFRAVDWRQLLVYCCLANVAGEHAVSTIGLINARHGTFVRLTLDQVSLGLAGVGSAELLAQIVFFISTEQLST
jgi:hypothetical protein